MTKQGDTLREAAKLAIRIVESGQATPDEAWHQALAKATKALRGQGAPKAAFVALAETGCIQGIPAIRSRDKLEELETYAIRMAQLLVDDPDYEMYPEALHQDAIGKPVGLNGQVDVVMGVMATGRLQHPPA